MYSAHQESTAAKVSSKISTIRDTALSAGTFPLSNPFLSSSLSLATSLVKRSTEKKKAPASSFSPTAPTTKATSKKTYTKEKEPLFKKTIITSATLSKGGRKEKEKSNISLEIKSRMKATGLTIRNKGTE